MMEKSPFKFLDSFTKEDKEIFFGRDQEIEELYAKVFESKLLLVYGVSGTGKSSLIQCGLSNKFQESDWLPINIRRGQSILKSIDSELKKYAITPFDEKRNTLFHIRSVYLDYFKPIYLIFDQFEELFIFASLDERITFVSLVKQILESDIPCKMIFVIREEYLANITEFEKEIPIFLKNRIRIEKMSRINAKQAIEGPCKVFNIELESNFADNLLDKLGGNKNEVELTYLQVFLDKIYRASI